MKTQTKKIIMMLFFGIIIFIFLVKQNKFYQSNLTEIKFEDSLNIEVKDAYNERGKYILNDMYFINSATFIISKNTIQIKEDAIWRPSGSEHIPRISDITAPFLIYKSKDNDTISIIKDENKIFLLLTNE